MNASLSFHAHVMVDPDDVPDVRHHLNENNGKWSTYVTWRKETGGDYVTVSAQSDKLPAILRQLADRIEAEPGGPA